VLDPDARLSEARVQPQKCESHIKSASELPNLGKFFKYQDQTRGSTKSAFNKQIRTQTDEVKMRRSSNPCLTYQWRNRVWMSQTRVWASRWRFGS